MGDIIVTEHQQIRAANMSKFINVNLKMNTRLLKIGEDSETIDSFLIGIYVNDDIDKNLITEPVRLVKHRIFSLIRGGLTIVLSDGVFYLEEDLDGGDSSSEARINILNHDLSHLEKADTLLFHFEKDITLDSWQEVIYPCTIHGKTLATISPDDREWPYSGLAALHVQNTTSPSRTVYKPFVPLLLGGGILNQKLSVITDLFADNTRPLLLNECMLEVDDMFIGTNGTSPTKTSIDDVHCNLFGNIKQIVLADVITDANATDGIVVDLSPRNRAIDSNSNIVEEYDGDIYTDDGNMDMEGVYVTIDNEGLMKVYLSGVGYLDSSVELITDNDRSVNRMIRYEYNQSPTTYPTTLMYLLNRLDIPTADPSSVMYLLNYMTIDGELPRLLHFVEILRECLLVNNIIFRSVLHVMDTLYPHWRSSYPLLSTEVELRREKDVVMG